MSAYASHDSSIGSVFDIGTWSRERAQQEAVIVLVVSAVMLFAAAFFYCPEWFMQVPADGALKDGYDWLAQWRADHSKTYLAILGAGALIGVGSLAYSIARFQDAVGDYYLRVGPGGVSLRVPDGADLSKACLKSEVLEIEARWSEIHLLTVIQRKEYSTLSSHGVNSGAKVRLELVSGKTYSFSVDLFREPGYVIHQRINEITSVFSEQPEETELEVERFASWE